jgi:adenosylcobinamide amidohydrolase
VLANPATETSTLTLDLAPRWLVVRLSDEHVMTSWAPVGGGVCRARVVAWHEVQGAELAPPIDAGQLLADRLAARGLGGAVGLLTARRLDRHVRAISRRDGVIAEVVATVGLGNQLRVGDPPEIERAAAAGTINILCRLSTPLTPAAALEALSIAAEARTVAVREAAVPSERTGRFATGTGTDCIVIAAPVAVGQPAAAHAGKHTAIGHVIGAAVAEAIAQGVEGWLADQRVDGGRFRAAEHGGVEVQ